MAGAKRVRWECPEGLHKGVLGPQRPRKENICRYCLPCSEKAGKLVERTAPALERTRAAKAAVTSEREAAAAAKKATTAAGRELYPTAAGPLDVREELRTMLALPTIATAFRENRPRERRRVPAFRVVERKANGSAVSGRAWWGEYRMVLNHGPKLPKTETARELILHELVHLVAPRREGHGEEFRRLLRRASRELWPGIELPPNTGGVYDMDRAIGRAATARAQAADPIPED